MLTSALSTSRAGNYVLARYTDAKRLLRRTLTWMNLGLIRALGRPFEEKPGASLIFAPHPDDETLGCGAFIARRRYDGYSVHVVFITDGGGSHFNHPHLTRDELIQVRRREARAALAHLGVESCCSHFLDEPDGTLATLSAERREALTARIADLIQYLQPTSVVLPVKPDASSEHDVAHDLILAALDRVRSKPVLWQYAIWSWWNPVLQLRLLWRNGLPTHLSNADFTDAKRAAIECYRSQTEPTPPWSEPVIPPALVTTMAGDFEYLFPVRRRES